MLKNTEKESGVKDPVQGVQNAVRIDETMDKPWSHQFDLRSIRPAATVHTPNLSQDQMAAFIQVAQSHCTARWHS